MNAKEGNNWTMEPPERAMTDDGEYEAHRVHLNRDVWHQVIQKLDTGRDLCNLCLVSKDFYSLAVPYLYHTLFIGPRYFTSPEDQDANRSRVTRWRHFINLVRRFVENPNGQQAHAVREVDISHLNADDRELEDQLVALAKCLPNLRQFRIQRPGAYFATLIRYLHAHPNKPQIHLDCESGLRAVAGPMPSVATLRALVSPRYQANEPDQVILGVQELLFACPNLKSFSFTDYKDFGGCGGPEISFDDHPPVRNFRLTGDETWPPLESLSLNGYCPTPEEWIHWQHGINWTKLTSLTIGPQGDEPSRDFLECLRRSRLHAGSLRSLIVQTYETDSKPLVGDFIMSFDSLEQLVVKGQFVPCRAVCNHPRLKRLCLHDLELPRSGRAPRPTPNIVDLSELDRRCPDLEELEIDIYRDKSGWPQDITTALASGFSNLRHLTLHSEVGIDWENQDRYYDQDAVEPLLLPRIDEDMAKKFGEAFFAARGRSKLETLTLKTGEDLRRFPQWAPDYQQHESHATVEFRMWARLCSCGSVGVYNDRPWGGGDL